MRFTSELDPPGPSAAPHSSEALPGSFEGIPMARIRAHEVGAKANDSRDGGQEELGNAAGYAPLGEEDGAKRDEGCACCTVS